MVEIIPKPAEQVDNWQKVLVYVMVFVIVVLVGVYFLLNNLIGDSEVYLDELEAKIAKGRTQERIDLEEQNIYYRNKIEALLPFLDSHILSSKFFVFLSENTHPRIFFSKLNLSAGEARVVLSGSTDSFSTLDQQLSILGQEALIKDLVLTTASINKAGGIDFDLEIHLSKEMFLY